MRNERSFCVPSECDCSMLFLGHSRLSKSWDHSLWAGNFHLKSQYVAPFAVVRAKPGPETEAAIRDRLSHNPTGVNNNPAEIHRLSSGTGMASVDQSGCGASPPVPGKPCRQFNSCTTGAVVARIRCTRDALRQRGGGGHTGLGPGAVASGPGAAPGSRFQKGGVEWRPRGGSTVGFEGAGPAWPIACIARLIKLEKPVIGRATRADPFPPPDLLLHCPDPLPLRGLQARRTWRSTG